MLLYTNLGLTNTMFLRCKTEYKHFRFYSQTNTYSFHMLMFGQKALVSYLNTMGSFYIHPDIHFLLLICVWLAPTYSGLPGKSEIFLNRPRDITTPCPLISTPVPPSVRTKHIAQDASYLNVETTSIGSFQYGGVAALLSTLTVFGSNLEQRFTEVMLGQVGKKSLDKKFYL